MCVRAVGQDADESAVPIRNVRSPAVLWCHDLPAHEWEEADLVLSCVWPPRRVQQTHHWWVCCIYYCLTNLGIFSNDWELKVLTMGLNT